jgi:peptide/nickel transport system permease protein
MIGYIARRCLITVILAWVVATLVFLFLRAIPGDPVEVMLSQSNSAGGAPSPAVVAALKRQLGLDEPLYVQYGNYISNIAHFDLGRSFISGRPVAADVEQRLPRTIELIVAATLVGLPVGLLLGLLAAIRRGRPVDIVISFLSSSGISIPVFVLGTVLVLVFAQLLALLPAGGFVDFQTDPLQNLKEVTLPAISLGFSLMAVITRMTRSAVLDVLRQDWVRTARAKGAPARIVLIRHVLRNALNPVVTVLGLQMGSLLGGTVLVEYVFNWPGLSSLLVQSAEQRDYPEVQGIVLIIALLFILLNLVTDITYSILDPRVRFD